MFDLLKFKINVATDYAVLIIPSKKFNASTTSASAYIKLYGTLGESDVCTIPKSTLEFVISVNEIIENKSNFHL